MIILRENAVGFCALCGKEVCPDDAAHIDNKFYCKKCAREMLSDQTAKNKKLYRSQKNKSICGVCGGLAEYIHVDPMPLLVVWFLLTLFTGIFPGVVVYLQCVL